ncbi:MAG: 16S rRNA (cytosine(967)-C(5))-methyltransferase [Pseudanabaena sp. ELA607]
MKQNDRLQARQLALDVLRQVDRRGAYADVALNQCLSQYTQLHAKDRHFLTELVYGCTRRRRTLDALLQNFAHQPIAKLPPDLRLILHLGLYQLAFLDRVLPSAIVHTTVELAKTNALQGLSGLVNAILRQALRKMEQKLLLSGINDIAERESFPDWLVNLWIEQFGVTETAALCGWFNQIPRIDLRANRLYTTAAQLQEIFANEGIETDLIPGVRDGLRLTHHVGSLTELPKYADGWWSVQDASAQLAVELLDPQPKERILDACAAPGGKTTHIAERMGNKGYVWALDLHQKRLKKVQDNSTRLGITCIETHAADFREFTLKETDGKPWDRILLDVPCSGLGTLHRHADARWRQTPADSPKLAQLQLEILTHGATLVREGGTLVYSTCTLHPAENELVIAQFLAAHPDWQIVPPAADSGLRRFSGDDGTLRILPHHHDMDGFFLVRLGRG